MSLLTYTRLLRIPNVFTAFADIALGGFVAGTLFDAPMTFVLLLLASGSLYCGGMVLNDVFDREIDARERPYRPIPSGRIAVRTAAGLGAGLLVVGIAFAAFAGPGSATIAGLIAVAVLLYDGGLKTTRFGPVSMASCRFLNVLLGLSIASPDVVPWAFRLHLAAVVGVYIVGVTWFARKEAETSRTNDLTAAAGVMLAALVLAVPLPLHVPAGTASPLFIYLLVAFGFLVGGPVSRAVAKPTADRVQAGVKRAVLGLIVLDAVLATVAAGAAGLLIVCLLPPALLLGRWIYST